MEVTDLHFKKVYLRGSLREISYHILELNSAVLAL